LSETIEADVVERVEDVLDVDLAQTIAAEAPELVLVDMEVG